MQRGISEGYEFMMRYIMIRSGMQSLSAFQDYKSPQSALQYLSHSPIHIRIHTLVAGSASEVLPDNWDTLTHWLQESRTQSE